MTSDFKLVMNSIGKKASLMDAQLSHLKSNHIKV